MRSRAGTCCRRPVADQRAKAPAPGNQGMVASTSTSQRRPRAASCCRLNGADSGSSAFGKILVTTRTRIAAVPLRHVDRVARQQREVLIGAAPLEDAGIVDGD